MPTQDEEMKDQDLDNESVEETQETEKKPAENMIPKHRFDEVNTKYKELKRQLDELTANSRKAEETRLKEQNDFRSLYERSARALEELAPKAQKYEEAEAVLENLLSSQLSELPEEVAEMVPEELSTIQKLNWLSKNRSKLLKPSAFDIGAGKKNGTTKKAELTPEEMLVAKKFGMTPEEYAKFKS